MCFENFVGLVGSSCTTEARALLCPCRHPQTNARALLFFVEPEICMVKGIACVILNVFCGYSFLFIPLLGSALRYVNLFMESFLVYIVVINHH